MEWQNIEQPTFKQDLPKMQEEIDDKITEIQTQIKEIGEQINSNDQQEEEHDECDDYVTLIIIFTYERVPDNYFRSTSKQGLNVYLLDSLIRIFVV